MFGRSSDAMPISSVAQRMNPWSLARSFWYWPRTWSSVPNRPWPYSDGRTVTGVGPVDRDPGDDAVEVGRVVAVAGRQAVGPEGEATARRAVGRQVARDLVGADDLPRDLRVLRLGEVLDVGDRERRRGPLNRQVGHRRVAELGEGVVAHRQHPPGDVLVAGDREVPGEVEVRAPDAGAAQRVEDRVEARALGLDRGRRTRAGRRGSSGSPPGAGSRRRLPVRRSRSATM